MLKKNNQFYKLFTSCSDNYFLRKNNFRPQTKYYILICAGPTLGIFFMCLLLYVLYLAEIWTINDKKNMFIFVVEEFLGKNDWQLRIHIVRRSYKKLP
jgi:hypothetical protein